MDVTRKKLSLLEFLFFFLPKYVYLFPKSPCRLRKYLEAFMICLDNRPVLLWCESRFLQVTNIPYEFSECLSCLKSWLIGMFVIKTLRDSIKNTISGDIIKRFSLTILPGKCSILLDNLVSKTMKGHNIYSIGVMTNHTRETFSHVFYRIIRKCKTEYIISTIVSNLENMSDSSRQKLGLPTSWSRKHQYWSINSLYRQSLLFIE